MGDFNKIDGCYELPLPRDKCPPCDGSGKDKDAECVHCRGDGCVGPELTIKLRGRVRNIVKALFEDWLEGQARRRVFDMRQTMNPQEFRESMDAVARGVGSYTFAWGGDAWAVSLGNIRGQAKYFYLLMQDADRLTNERQTYEEPDFIRWLKSRDMAVMFADANKQIMDATPNFLAPPVRGEED